ncbi:unnamed protein product [Ambrosiozyma monospora]|uniref:Unnamed protein product n=1 Tax=Ambrosiozyma monospora TaxID=43982 RepID=A0ACB5T2S0_AMBMO|nr:unnamed protein product [Ambrosiozyma monospora]
MSKQQRPKDPTPSKPRKKKLSEMTDAEKFQYLLSKKNFMSDLSSNLSNSNDSNSSKSKTKVKSKSSSNSNSKMNQKSKTNLSSNTTTPTTSTQTPSSSTNDQLSQLPQPFQNQQDDEENFSPFPTEDPVPNIHNLPPFKFSFSHSQPTTNPSTSTTSTQSQPQTQSTAQLTTEAIQSKIDLYDRTLKETLMAIKNGNLQKEQDKLQEKLIQQERERLILKQKIMNQKRQHLLLKSYHRFLQHPELFLKDGQGSNSNPNTSQGTTSTTTSTSNAKTINSTSKTGSASTNAVVSPTVTLSFTDDPALADADAYISKHHQSLKNLQAHLQSFFKAHPEAIAQSNLQDIDIAQLNALNFDDIDTPVSFSNTSTLTTPTINTNQSSTSNSNSKTNNYSNDQTTAENDAHADPDDNLDDLDDLDELDVDNLNMNFDVDIQGLDLDHLDEMDIDEEEYSRYIDAALGSFGFNRW